MFHTNKYYYYYYYWNLFVIGWIVFRNPRSGDNQGLSECSSDPQQDGIRETLPESGMISQVVHFLICLS